MRKVLLYIWCGIALWSCSNQDGTPHGILDKKKMGNVLWAILKADATSHHLSSGDSTWKAVEKNALLQKEVFDTQKITREEFYKSYVYYQHHPELMEAMLDSMIAQQEVQRRRFYQQQANIKHEQDSIRRGRSHP